MAGYRLATQKLDSVAELEKRKFKDWFNQKAAYDWADQVTSVFPEFDSEQFVRITTRGLGLLEFKDRVQRFARALAETLPDDIPTALGILTESLPEPLPDCDSPTDGWLQWPLGEFIAEFCLDYPEEALYAMEELTQRFTSEYAIRPFVQNYPDLVFEYLGEMVSHESAHVRRWCSEGVRPRLPWGTVLPDLVSDPTPILPILEELKDDPELYVRRSVANNLNDIAKDHPDLIVDICKSWMKDAPEERKWTVRHGLRTLIKSAHPGALALQGFHPVPPELEVQVEATPRTLVIGETVELKAVLTNRSPRQLRLQVDLILHYVRQKGKTSGKVFKWKALDLKSGQRVTLKKEQAMIETTVSALYPGRHKVAIQINGAHLASSEFHLL